ncbi:hypothetical protein FB451DRAFT_1190096 [Mycena latifolia]|nr:hypothetical protein FB451DRAFT_1190096 [Mycena latifolia]
MGKRKPKQKASGREESAEDLAAARFQRRRETHRKASTAYDARHPEMKEKRRLARAAQRAQAKLKKRQWDPPKRPRTAPPPPSETSRHTEPPPSETRHRQSEARSEVAVTEEGIVMELRVANLIEFEAQMDLELKIRTDDERVDEGAMRDVQSAMDVAVAPSLNADEKLALLALAGMARGRPTNQDNHEVDSVLAMALLLSSHGTSIGEPHARSAALPPPHLEHESARVHRAQLAVATLNAKPFSALAIVDVYMWDAHRSLELLHWLPMSLASYRCVATWWGEAEETADNSWDAPAQWDMEELAKRSIYLCMRSPIIIVYRFCLN